MERIQTDVTATRWADTREAARIVRCHPEVLRRWHREGSAPFALPRPKRRGRQYFWDADALHAAMEALETDERYTGTDG
ncbi:excisionase [Nocardia sp. NPDC057663]|uniref:excisionase n=1 Tax=Nocardia sp. NPDC057663 TaxID=3346201 RepID=UPI00366CB687